MLLQQDPKKAKRELGQATFPLVESGALDHPDLTEAAERVCAAQGTIDGKKAGFAELGAPSDEIEDAAEAPAIWATAADETTAHDAPVEEEDPSA